MESSDYARSQYIISSPKTRRRLDSNEYRKTL